MTPASITWGSSALVTMTTTAQDRVYCAKPITFVWRVIASEPKNAVRLGTPPPPPAPTWRFYARHHPHSLWHGDCLEKVFDQATGRQLYQVTLLDDYSRGYVFCDLFDQQSFSQVQVDTFGANGQ
jgi:hypothetical protein